MPSVLDPRMIVAYPLDESGALDARKSITTTVHSLTAKTDTGSQGVPTVADGVAGRAVRLLDAQTGLTTTRRRVEGPSGAWNTHPVYVPLPRTSGATGFAYGIRANYRSAKGSANHFVCGTTRSTTGVGHIGLIFGANAGATAGRLSCVLPDLTTESITGGGWTDTDGLVAALGADYMTAGVWWRAAVRYTNLGGTTYSLQVVLLKESTGVRYRLTRTAALSMDYSSPTAVVRASLGCEIGGMESFQGDLDDFWILNGDLSEEAAVESQRGGLSISREDDDTYRSLPWVVVDAVYDGNSSEEVSTYPMVLDSRILGAVPARAAAEAFSIRLRSFAAGAPMVPKWMSSIYIQKGRTRGSVR